MKIDNLNKRPTLEQNSKLSRKYIQFEKLVEELQGKELTNEVMHSINLDIVQINAIADSNKILGTQIRKMQSKILKLIEKEHKLVTKNHYRNTWLAVGMAAFGIPLGVAFGASLGNMAFIGLGMPIGMVIGMAVGTNLDKKARENGKQLDVEIIL